MLMVAAGSAGPRLIGSSGWLTTPFRAQCWQTLTLDPLWPLAPSTANRLLVSLPFSFRKTGTGTHRHQCLLSRTKVPRKRREF